MNNVTWQSLFQDAQDVYGRSLDETTMIRRANRLIDDIKLIANLPTQIRTNFIDYVYEFERYKLLTDYKTEGIISLRYDDYINNNRIYGFTDNDPYPYNQDDHWVFLTPEIWTERKMINQATIVVNKGKEKLWLSNGRAEQTNQEISLCDSLTGWVGSNGATNLTLDDLVKTEGNYSINYDITSGTTPDLTLTLTNSIDLSEYLENGIIRLNKWLPTVPTTIQIQIGEDSSNYYYQNITTQADGENFDASDMNELEFKFRSATLTGTPDMTVCLHFKIIMTFSSAITDTDFRIDNIKAWKPQQLVIEYYSYYMITDENSDWSEYLTDGNDESINILPEWRKPFIKGLLIEELEKNGDKRAEKYEKDYLVWIKEIQQRYPNRAKRTGSFYY
jgi:hypothetical protein